MERLSGSICERMPQDLFQYMQQNIIADIPVCEQEPADVAVEVLSAGPFEMKAYFPVSHRDKTVVFVHLPGG